MIRPSTRVKLALRAARRRRYGWAALRVLRAGLRAALGDLRAWTINAHDDRRKLDGRAELLEIRARYMRAVRELRKRFPSLSLLDERSTP